VPDPGVAPAPARSIDLEPALAPTLERVSCPHMAIVLEDIADLPRALASFYALGLRRNGWLYHRALPGHGGADREALEQCGLDVGGLERDGRLELCELPVTDPPERWAQPFVPMVERALERGFDAVWWSRFPVGADERRYRAAYEYDRHFEACFHGRQAVSMCVYIVGEVAPDAREHRTEELRQIHDATVIIDAHDRVDVLPRS
jgi:hypothetical protein